MNNEIRYSIEIKGADGAARVLATMADPGHAEGVYADVKAALSPGEDLYLTADDGSTLAACTMWPGGEVTESRVL